MNITKKYFCNPNTGDDCLSPNTKYWPRHTNTCVKSTTQIEAIGCYKGFFSCSEKLLGVYIMVRPCDTQLFFGQETINILPENLMPLVNECTVKYYKRIDNAPDIGLRGDPLPEGWYFIYTKPN